jgi:hypothetical protein
MAQHVRLIFYTLCIMITIFKVKEPDLATWRSDRAKQARFRTRNKHGNSTGIFKLVPVPFSTFLLLHK